MGINAIPLMFYVGLWASAVILKTYLEWPYIYPMVIYGKEDI